MFGSQLASRAAVDGLGVELLPEAQHQVGSVGHLDGEPHVRGGLADRLSQPGRINIELWRLVVLAGTVEADQCVEVDDAAALELRDLDKRHPAPPGELGCGQPGNPGQRAADGDGEPAPQLGGVPVERDMPGVVVAVRADRLAESRVVVGVDGHAPARPPVWAQPWCAAGGPAARGPGSVGAGGVHRPESGCGEGGEHQRVGSDRFRDALTATGGAGVEELPHIAGVLIRAGRAHGRSPVAAPDQQDSIRFGVR